MFLMLIENGMPVSLIIYIYPRLICRPYWTKDLRMLIIYKVLPTTVLFLYSN